MKWYGLFIDDVLISVKRFHPDYLPNLNKVEDFRLWDVQFQTTSTYVQKEVNVNSF